MFTCKLTSGAFSATIAIGSSKLIANRSIAIRRSFRTTSIYYQMTPKKPGVASLNELTKFVESAGSKLVIVDVRNPNAKQEPTYQKSIAVAPIPDPTNGIRPSGINLVWDRASNTMSLPEVTKDTPLITHCGGGGRGQKAKEFLESKGFTNVLNGAGPKETELWALYGEK